MLGGCFSRLPSPVAADVGMVGKRLTTTMSRISHLILALILGLFCLFLLFQTVVSPVRAVDLIVLNTDDSGAGSLRQAIADAGNGDTILFDSSLNGQTITLTSGQLLITKTLTISGPGANLLAISGNNASRVFYITSTATISGVTIKEGLAFPGGGIYNSGTLNLINSTVFSNAVNTLSVGGGIYNSGTANLINSTVFSNTATSGGGIRNSGFSSSGTLNLINSTVFSNTAPRGGGIENSLGTINLTNSTISGNKSDSGGGIFSSSGTVTLTNSTVSDNTAADNGGGIYDHFGTVNLTNSTISGNSANGGGGIVIQGTVTLINSTVSGNTGTFGSGIWNEDGNLNLINSTILSNTGALGGIWNRTGTMTLTNTILAYNRVGALAKDCTNDSGGTVISSGYNLVQAPNNCVFSATGDITNTNPLLGPLTDNGGATLTHALLNGSLIINHIPKGTNGCGTTITTDQRGVIRPQGSGCDIGAYEAYELGYLYLPLIFSN